MNRCGELEPSKTCQLQTIKTAVLERISRVELKVVGESLTRTGCAR